MMRIRVDARRGSTASASLVAQTGMLAVNAPHFGHLAISDVLLGLSNAAHHRLRRVDGHARTGLRS